MKEIVVVEEKNNLKVGFTYRRQPKQKHTRMHA